MWDSWFGSTLWVRDGSNLEPVPVFRYCPNCGEEMERSGSDDIRVHDMRQTVRHGNR